MNELLAQPIPHIHTCTTLRPIDLDSPIPGCAACAAAYAAKLDSIGARPIFTPVIYPERKDK